MIRGSGAWHPFARVGAEDARAVRAVVKKGTALVVVDI